jgi:hypothetical protein
VQIVVSDQAARITGTVTSSGAAAAGTPVFLWPVAEANRRSLAGGRTTIADTDGHYQFEGLPPGDYRVFASFDFTQVDADAFEEAQAATIAVRAGQSAMADLRVWMTP